MTGYTPTAAELAEFDQVLALTNDTLDELVHAHAHIVGGLDEHQALSVAGLAGYLTNITHDACAQLLAVAVDRLTALEDNRV